MTPSAAPGLHTVEDGASVRVLSEAVSQSMKGGINDHWAVARIFRPRPGGGQRWMVAAGKQGRRTHYLAPHTHRSQVDFMVKLITGRPQTMIKSDR